MTDQKTIGEIIREESQREFLRRNSVPPHLEGRNAFTLSPQEDYDVKRTLGWPDLPHWSYVERQQAEFLADPAKVAARAADIERVRAEKGQK